MTAIASFNYETNAHHKSPSILSKTSLIVPTKLNYEILNIKVGEYATLTAKRFTKQKENYNARRSKLLYQKKQLIFLEKCLTHDATPKSFRIKPPTKSQKTTRYQKRKNMLRREIT